MSKKSIVAQSKQAERHVAGLLNGRRLHAGEYCGIGDVDVIAPSIIIQVKHRSGVPGYITEGMEQVRQATKSMTELRRLAPDWMVEDPLPVLALQTKPGSGKPAETFFVVDAAWFRLLHRLLVKEDAPSWP